MTTPFGSVVPVARSAAVAMDVSVETVDEKLLRFLQYECGYRHCKYPNSTWGEIIVKDYPHFVDLMSHHTPVESKTFDVLKEKLSPSDLKTAMTSNRVRIVESPDELRERYLKMVCSHNGRMKGKTWGHILKADYEYFVWAVGNTMGRDTRSFQVFFKCLSPADQVVVENTPKGQVKVRRAGRRANKRG